MIKYIFTLLIFLLQCFTLFAGSFRPLSIKEGLSSRQVFQVSKDSAGFIWAYTHMGVDRYDGNEIKHWTKRWSPKIISCLPLPWPVIIRGISGLP